MCVKANKISDLLKELRSDDLVKRKDAIAALGEFKDERAVYPLVICLKDQVPAIRQSAMEALVQIGTEMTVYNVIPLLRDSKASVRNIAVEILEKIGNVAKACLIELFSDKDEDVRKFAVDIISTLQASEAIPGIIQLLGDSDPNVRSAAASALGSMQVKEAAGELVKLLGDDEWVQCYAIKALGEIGDEVSLPILKQKIAESETPIRLLAIEALREIGSDSFMELLPCILVDSDEEVVIEGLKTLATIGVVDAQKILKKIDRESFSASLSGRLFKDKENATCILRVIETLNLSELSGELIRYLSSLEMDDEEDMEIAELAGAVLASVATTESLVSALSEVSMLPPVVFRILGDRKAKEAAPTLLELLPKAPVGWKQSILFALGEIGGDEAVESIQNRLSDELGHVRREAVIALGKMNGKFNVDAIFKMMRQENYPDVLEAAISVLVKLGTDEVRKKLIALASSEKDVLRKIVVRGLGLLKEEDSIPVLKIALNDCDWKVRREAILALSSFTTPEVGESILLMMNDESAEVKLTALEAYSEKFMHDEQIFENLLVALNESYYWIRYRAVEMLGKIRNQRAVEPLLELFDKEDVPIKIAIIQALGNIGGEVASTALKTFASAQQDEVGEAARFAQEDLNY